MEGNLQTNTTYEPKEMRKSLKIFFHFVSKMVHIKKAESYRRMNSTLRADGYNCRVYV